MIKKIYNAITRNTTDGSTDPSEKETGKPSKSNGMITQVHKGTGAVATPGVEPDDQQEERECCLVRYCRCFMRQDDYIREVEPAEEFIFLGPQSAQNLGRKTLVLDLDETLVHSSFEGNDDPDLLLPVKIQDEIFKIRVMVRPGVEEYLRLMGEVYEVVVFTASLSEYADPLVDILDKTGVVAYRLFREHCTLYNGVYVKDLSRLGRDLKDIIIVDNSPNSFMFQPKNALLIKNFFDDKTDTELDILTPFFQFMAGIFDVRPTEAWRAKFYKGEAEEFLQLQNSKRLASDQFMSEGNEQFPEDDRSPLNVDKSKNKSKEWDETEDDIEAGTDSAENNAPEQSQDMANPKFMTGGKSSRRGSYSIVGGSGVKAKTNKSSNLSHIKASDLFSPKTENDEKPHSGSNRSFFLPSKKNYTDRFVERNCLTENITDDLEPYELEKVKQLEISNEEEVEDPHKVDRRRFLNNDKLNIQSPIHKTAHSFVGLTTENAHPTPQAEPKLSTPQKDKALYKIFRQGDSSGHRTTSES